MNTGQSSHCAVRLPGCVCFQREEEAIQINRQPSQGSLHQNHQPWCFSSSLSVTHTTLHSLSLSPMQQSRISLWDGLRFSQQCCLFACLGQTTYVAHSRKRVNSPFLLPPSSLFLVLLHPLPHSRSRCFGGSFAPVSLRSACGIIFVRGSCV